MGRFARSYAKVLRGLTRGLTRLTRRALSSKWLCSAYALCAFSADKVLRGAGKSLTHDICFSTLTSYAVLRIEGFVLRGVLRGICSIPKTNVLRGNVLDRIFFYTI